MALLPGQKGFTWLGRSNVLGMMFHAVARRFNLNWDAASAMYGQYRLGLGAKGSSSQPFVRVFSRSGRRSMKYLEKCSILVDMNSRLRWPWVRPPLVEVFTDRRHGRRCKFGHSRAGTSLLTCFIADEGSLSRKNDPHLSRCFPIDGSGNRLTS